MKISEDTLIYVDKDYISKGYICYHFEEHVTYAGKVLDNFAVISHKDAEEHNLTLCPRCARIVKNESGGDKAEE